MKAVNRNQVGCWGDYQMTPPHDPTPLKPSNGAVLGGVHGAHAATPLKASKYAAGAGVIFHPLRGRSGVTPPRGGDGAEHLHPSSCYLTLPRGHGSQLLDRNTRATGTALFVRTLGIP